jgi:hypothetical protein
MPVDTLHDQYRAHLEQWQRCRDAIAGSDAVQAAGETYLPKLGGQDATEYDAYKTRATYYNASARTLQALVGALFRKPPTVAWPEGLADHLDDITQTGLSLPAFALLVATQTLTTGRYGVLVEYPAPGSAPGSRPRWVGYPAEAICHWRTRRVGEATVLSLVVLYEEVEDDDPADPFVPLVVPQYRVLSLDEANFYRVDLWRGVERTTDDGQTVTTWQVVETLEPDFRGERLDYIPFRFFPDGPEVSKPPLLDLVDLNLSHYRSSADLEHGRHFCGLPTPWVAGFDPDTELRIGSSVAWVSTDVNAKAGMLEFTGQGLGALEKALQEKEAKMAAIGARLLEEPKREAETAETTRLRQSGEASVLQTFGQRLSEGLTACAAWHVAWLGSDPDPVSLALNADFASLPMGAPELTALWAVYLGGGMSFETWYHNLTRGELTRPDVDAETERALIEAQRPAPPSLGEEE